MNAAIRLFSIVSLALLLAACGRETRDVPPEPSEPDRRPVQPSEPVQVDRVDPADFADSRNLENPDSLLSQREVFFEFDRSNVRPEFLPVIRAHAAYARANRTARIMLEGHTDERGSREYNLGLGERRGNSVRDLLLAEGAAANQIEVVSYGEERPVCRASNEACWERNRRAEIVYTAR